MNRPADILREALALLGERGLDYDSAKSGVEQNYRRAASIASNWLDKPVTARDVAVIMASVKMSRLAVSPFHEDSFVDLVNYVAIAGALSLPVEKLTDDTFADAIEKTLSAANGNGA